MPTIAIARVERLPIPTPQPIRSAVPDLEAAMIALGEASVPEMLVWIEATFLRKWGESTVYAQLKKGRDAGRYVNENNKWRMATSVEDLA